MRVFLLGMTLVLGGCWTVREPVLPTQAEINAENARIQCRAIARTLVQIARCNGG